MHLNIFIIIIYNYYSIQSNIKNGVYNLKTENLYLYYHRRNLSLSNTFKHPNTYFRIKKVSKISSDTFYNIEELKTKFKLRYLENKELNFNKNNGEYNLWNFIKINDNNYVLKNKENCYIKATKIKVICDNIPLNQATQFQIIRIFYEVKEDTSSNYLEILDKEPIDILIKYIDLRDPNLKREGIHQIEKDYDNEELRYSIRSILTNIPWVRKIFILMPNKKVRFFKDVNHINEKIIYIKDKDILGYDSSNCNAFLFRYWKMKKFGISDNLIIMDDDCFIGTKLKKSDFFYIKQGKVLPAIISSIFLKIDKKSVQQNYELFQKKAEITKEEQNDDIFNYSKFLTFLFVLNLFNFSLSEEILIPKYTHNAIPVNIKDIKEIYDLASKSNYRYATLDCLYRHSGYLHFQIFILLYTFIRYNRKVKDIPYKYIVINNSISANYQFPLFCINKGAGKYSDFNFYTSKIIMEYLFPHPSPYEIVDYSLINISFNITYTMDHQIKEIEQQLSQMLTKNDFYFFEIIQTLIFILIICKLYYTYF